MKLNLYSKCKLIPGLFIFWHTIVLIFFQPTNVSVVANANADADADADAEAKAKANVVKENKKYLCKIDISFNHDVYSNMIIEKEHDSDCGNFCAQYANFSPDAGSDKEDVFEFKNNKDTAALGEQHKIRCGSAARFTDEKLNTAITSGNKKKDEAALLKRENEEKIIAAEAFDENEIKFKGTYLVKEITCYSIEGSSGTEKGVEAKLVDAINCF